MQIFLLSETYMFVFSAIFIVNFEHIPHITRGVFKTSCNTYEDLSIYNHVENIWDKL